MILDSGIQGIIDQSQSELPRNQNDLHAAAPSRMNEEAFVTRLAELLHRYGTPSMSWKKFCKRVRMPSI